MKCGEPRQFLVNVDSAAMALDRVADGSKTPVATMGHDYFNSNEKSGVAHSESIGRTDESWRTPGRSSVPIAGHAGGRAESAREGRRRGSVVPQSPSSSGKTVLWRRYPLFIAGDRDI